jgi:hypothetical protein
MRVYRLTARDWVGEVTTLGEYQTHEAALDALARWRRDKLWHDFRIDEYVDGAGSPAPLQLLRETS